MRLLSSLGRLPGTWTALCLIVIAGMAEGVGLAMFVPLFDIMMQGEVRTLGFPFDVIQSAFLAVGLPVTLLTMLAAIFVLIFASLGIAYAQRSMVVRIRHQFSQSARKAYAQALYGSEWSYISEKSHGEAVNEFLNECNRASSALQYELLAVGAAIQILVYAAISTALSWELTAVSVAFLALVFAAVRPLQRRARVLGADTTDANRNLSFYIVDFLKGSKLIKSTATEPRVVGTLSNHIDTYFNVAYRSELNSVQIYFVVQALPVILVTGLIALSSYAFTLNASLTITFLLILARIAPRLAQFQQYAQGYNVASPGLEVVDRIIAEANEKREATRPDGYAFDRISSEILLDDVSYRYPSRESTALEHVTLRIPRHQMIAIVGASGAGKSTVVDMIAGLRRPDAGRILVDGRPLDDINLHSWRQRIGYVAQDIVVFNDTLSNNVAFGSADADRARVLEALEVSRLGDLVAELPDGLDTMMGENGTRLSGGQRQRLALARAIVGNPELLLLDEATSALDNESERLVQQAIEDIAGSFTVVVVAHRLSTIRRADVVHVMEQGRIVQSGTYDALLSVEGSFQQLHGLEFA